MRLSLVEACRGVHSATREETGKKEEEEEEEEEAEESTKESKNRKSTYSMTQIFGPIAHC